MNLALLSIHSSPLGRAGSKDTGGMSTYLRALSLALGQRGHQVDLYTRAATAGDDLVRQAGPNVRLICPADGLGGLVKNLLYPHCPAVAESIDRFKRRHQISYDHIFSHYWLSGVVGRILKQRWHVPHLHMFHTLGRAKNESCPGEKEPALRLETEAALARECDLIVCAAVKEKERILDYFNLAPEKVVLVPCGIDRSTFHSLDRKGRQEAKLQLLGRAAGKLILAVGRIEPVKGLDLTLKAAALLPAEDDFEIMFAGGDRNSRALVAALKEQAQYLGLAGKAHFAGVVAHDRLPLYYNAADTTVLSSYYESFGLIILESAACATPVVASPVGVAPELLGRNSVLGTLVQGRKPAHWAAAIRSSYSSKNPVPEAALKTGLAPYSWSEAAAGLEFALNSL